MKRSHLVLTLLVVVVGGAITWQSLKPQEPTTVVTAFVEQVPRLRSIVTATGEIRAKEFVDIQAEVTGVITELLVREGDTVQKGQVLLRIDDLQMATERDGASAQVGAAEAEAKNAEAAVATAEAKLAGEHTALANVKLEFEQARISRDRAKASYERKEGLYRSNLIGSEEFEISAAEASLAQQRFAFNEARISQAESTLKAVEAGVDAAKAGKDAAHRRVEAARATLVRANDLVAKTVLKAPLSGLITKLNVEKGERAVPGFQSNPIATLMTIADMSVIEAEIQVDEADIVNVALGATAEVEVDAIRDTKFAGVVTEIGQSPIQNVGGGSDQSGQNQEGKNFKVVVRITSPPPSLRVGLTATADIVTATREDCLVMPLQALTAREVEFDAEGSYVPPPEPAGDEPLATINAARRQNLKEVEGVFLIKEGRARFRPVRTGITGDMDIELLDGLKAGDEVVSGPYQALRTLKEWDRIEVDMKRKTDDAARLQRKRR